MKKKKIYNRYNQDHGVLAVIFSVLAMAFLFEIDDNLMEVTNRADEGD